jgi:predicted transcriptional regulator
MEVKKSDLLSADFKVAAEIYEYNYVKKEKVWFNKLVKSLGAKGGPSKATIAKSLNALFDWGIIKGEYGETEKGNAGRLLFVTNENKGLIRDIYEKYWKQ